MSEEKKRQKLKKVQEITVELEDPIEWGEETIEKLVLKRPKAKDMEHLPADPTFKDLLLMAQKCARVPRKVIQDLDSEDAISVVEAVSDFLDSGQKIGSRHSY